VIREHTKIAPHLATLALLFVCIGSCAERSGAPAKSSPPAESPPAQEHYNVDTKKERDRSEEERPATDSTTTLPSTPEAPRPSPAPTQPSVTPADGAERRTRALRAARTEVEQAQRELEASMNDCAAACRALGSMERATGHLCELATEHDDRRRCEDAKTAVLRAREKIRASCGSCPGGPSLEKTAPIPSRPGQR
jgi:hypothetical protein